MPLARNHRLDCVNAELVECAEELNLLLTSQPVDFKYLCSSAGGLQALFDSWRGARSTNVSFRDKILVVDFEGLLAEGRYFYVNFKKRESNSSAFGEEFQCAFIWNANGFYYSLGGSMSPISTETELERLILAQPKAS
jgi:hypothetical protein